MLTNQYFSLGRTDMAFAVYQSAGACTKGAQPGASALMTWAVRDFGQGAYNLGIYNCRKIRGKPQRSVHGEGRALDVGFSGRANPAGTRLVQALLPHVGKLGIQMIIWNRTVWSRKSPNGARYTGANPHYDHVHIELGWPAARSLNLTSIRAAVRGVATPAPAPKPAPSISPADLQKVAAAIKEARKHTLRRGSKGNHVKVLQSLLNTKGAKLRVDGDFGPAVEAAVRLYQSNVRKMFKLTNFAVDGVVGPATWFWLV